jgi:hypothetical protein
MLGVVKFWLEYRGRLSYLIKIPLKYILLHLWWDLL